MMLVHTHWLLKLHKSATQVFYGPFQAFFTLSVLREVEKMRYKKIFARTRIG